MTLRSRLLAGIAVLLAVLGVACAAVLYSQHRFLVGQLDDRIAPLATSPRPVIARLTAVRAGRPGGPPAALSEIYIGIRVSDGRSDTLLAPTSDPDLVPNVVGVHASTHNVTVTTTSGLSRRARVRIADLGNGTSAVFAISTAAAESAFRRLTIAMLVAVAFTLVVLVLLASWVVRFGLRPIRDMTIAADAIAAGNSDLQIDDPGGYTEAARLGRALNVMISTSRNAETRLRRFVADASHELRTPLTTLRGYAAMYETGRLADKTAVDDAMRRMSSESRRMSAMVDDLLLLAELDERHPFACEPVDLAAMLRELAADLAVVQPERPVSVDAGDDKWVDGDSDQLTQALSALLTNVRQHTSPHASVILRASAVDNIVRVEVTDHGSGIKAEDLPHLFERFYRADRSRSRSTPGGTGLGLAIVASIVGAHDGRCGATSSATAGTTFWLEFPSTDRRPVTAVTDGP